jgi:hypothetical protein
MRFLLFSVLTIFSTVAFSAEYSASKGKLIVGRCHMDGCWWFSVENAEKMGESKAGELFAITMKTWSASCPLGKCGRKSFDGAGTSFVFCSRKYPTWIDGYEEYNDPNKWTFTPLGPGSRDAFSGVHEGIHRMYWAACHGLDADAPFDAKLGQRYGYATELPKFHEEFDSFGKGFSNPFDILKLDQASAPQ